VGYTSQWTRGEGHYSHLRLPPSLLLGLGGDVVVEMLDMLLLVLELHNNTTTPDNKVSAEIKEKREKKKKKKKKMFYFIPFPLCVYVAQNTSNKFIPLTRHLPN